MRARQAVVLAAGSGSRMVARSGAVELVLSPDQVRAADAGFKAAMPLLGRPLFLHQLEELGAVGVERVVCVVPPDGERCRWFRRAGTERGLEVECVVQHEPRGTADALLVARGALGSAPFLMINSDNLYPRRALERLLVTEVPGLLGLDRSAALSDGRSNLSDRRMRLYALLVVDGRGRLVGILEKPDDRRWDTAPAPVLLGINAWLFDERIFAACELVAPSVRGEFELATAVQLAVDESRCDFSVVASRESVLDLSTRADVRTAEIALERWDRG